MKRIVLVGALIICLCMMLAACGCEHEYQEKVVRSATCGAEGELLKTCVHCGEETTEAIEKTSDHKYTEKVTVQATCAEEGEKTLTCSVCNKTEVEKVAKTTVHKYTEKVTVQATCAQEGEKTKNCTVCNKVEMVKIPKTTNHQYKEEVVKAATCAQPGTMKNTCTVCGDVKTTTTPKSDVHTTQLGKCTICNSLRTELLPTAKKIIAKYEAGMDYLNDSLDYIQKALNSSRFSGTLSAALNFGYAGNAFKEAIALCGNHPEFAAIKKQLQSASNRISNTFSGTITSYGDYRDLDTLKKILDSMDAITTNLKNIQNIVDVWLTYG